MHSEYAQIDFSAIYYRKILISVLVDKNRLLRSIDASDELKGQLILRKYGEVSKKEYWFFDYFQVGLQHESLLKRRVYIIQKLVLLITLQLYFFHLRLFFLYIFLHLVTQLVT